MRRRHEVGNEEWARAEPLLPRFGPEGEKRRFVNNSHPAQITAIPAGVTVCTWTSRFVPRPFHNS